MRMPGLGTQNSGLGSNVTCHPERSEGSAPVQMSRPSRFFVAEPVPTLNCAVVTMAKADSSLRSE